MKKHLVTLLKIALVAALMVFVFYRIQWKDTLVVTDPATEEVLTSTEGRILGGWDVDAIEFEPGDGSATRTVRQGEATDDGGILSIAPGFLTYIRNLDWLLFGLGAICYFVTVTIAATRWWWLLKVNRLEVGWGEAQRFTWIGTFFNNFMLGQTGGDVIKAIYIVKRCHGGRVPALVSVAVDRILGLGSLALLAAIVVLFTLDEFGQIALGLWGILGFVLAFGVVAFSKRIRRLVRIDVLLNRLPGRLSELLKRVDQAVYFYRGHKGGIVVWLILGSLNHVIAVSSWLLVGEALHIGMPWYHYFVLVPVILIASAVPIAPNGWGVGEALFSELFGRFGAAYLPAGTANPSQVMATRGVALSVLYRIHLTLWSLLGGVVTLLDKDRVTRQDLEEEAELEEQERMSTPSAT